MEPPTNYYNSKHSTVKSKSCTASGSSDYSTCSDNGIENICSSKENSRMSVQSVILAGQISTESDTSFAESFHSVNPLDQNLDAIENQTSDSQIENEDNFIDSRLNGKSVESNSDASTEYLPFEPVRKVLNPKPYYVFHNNLSNSNKLPLVDLNILSGKANNPLSVPTKSQDNERLITILEETEVSCTTNSLTLKNPSQLNNENSTGKLIVEMVDQIKNTDKINHFKMNSTKRVLFIEKERAQDDKNNRNNLKRKEKPNVLQDKNGCCSKKTKDINENCNNHNTTESFVFWEKFCQTNERLSLRRSRSFTDLTESYSGDDEYSTSYKTLDDTYLSHCSIDTISEPSITKKCFRHKSKSCESLLKEAKYLHSISKYLSKGIQNIKSQNVVCTCQKSNQNKSNKKNNGKSLKSTTLTKTSNECNDKKKTYCSLKVLPRSPKKTASSQTHYLSPEILVNYSSKNVQQLSPKSPNKTATTPTKNRDLYSWQKEIVSPIGEYIKGKRPSPYKNSPNKRKI